MPIYEFYCDRCETAKDVERPMSEAGLVEICDCGEVMRRRFSPFRFTIHIGGRQKVLDTLNREDGAMAYPGGEQHGARYDQAYAKGLDRNGQTGKYRSGVPVTSRDSRE